MQTKQLGKTGLTITPIGLGLAALGRPGYINIGHGVDLGNNTNMQMMQQNAFTVLDTAWNAGIRYFDAARSYGQAEQFLAAWLQMRNIPPNAVTIGSKWGYSYTANWQVNATQHEIKDHSLPLLQQQWGESRALLAAHLDLYQIHSATVESGVLSNEAVLEELRKLRREGVQIGLTLSGERQEDALRQALRCRCDGEMLFTTVQATFNILEQSIGATLFTAHDIGIGVIIKEALANGRLTSRNQEPDFASKLAELTGLANENNATVDALALAFVMAQPWVDVVLSGATTVPQLMSNMAANNVSCGNDLTRKLRGFSEQRQAYWAKRSQLAWN